MKKELVFVMIAAVCVFAIAVFMIGGVLQDVDYHDLSKLPLLEQKAAYDKMQTRRTIGEVMQLIGAILALTGFITVTVVSLSISHYNAKEAEKKYVKK
ncbi:MAG: hypothetical protein IKQ18_00635 [Clostridia bacterium]|nr:hypothetical protein [Clostridia bacterium]